MPSFKKVTYTGAQVASLWTFNTSTYSGYSVSGTKLKIPYGYHKGIVAKPPVSNVIYIKINYDVDDTSYDNYDYTASHVPLNFPDI